MRDKYKKLESLKGEKIVGISLGENVVYLHFKRGFLKIKSEGGTKMEIEKLR